jgi:hypothetical protein
MKRYLIEIELHISKGYKGDIRNKKGYNKFIEELRRTRQLGTVDTQKLSFEHDYRIDPPIEHYRELGCKITEIEECA